MSAQKHNQQPWNEISNQGCGVDNILDPTLPLPVLLFVSIYIW